MNFTIQQLRYMDNTITHVKPVSIEPSHNTVAIIIHVFYIDVWQEIKTYLANLDIAYDLFVTLPVEIPHEQIIDIFQETSNIHLYMTENRGRDVLPFLEVLNIIGIDNYEYICKLHTKKTSGSILGNVWRKLLYFDLIGSHKTVESILSCFNTDDSVGMITGKNTILDSQKYAYGNSKNIALLAERSGVIYEPYYLFAAGTMFWTRAEILKPIVQLFQNGQLDFEEEKGQTENTLAHAIERFFGILVQQSEQKIMPSPSNYITLDEGTLEDLASLVLSQQYMGVDVFVSQKQKIQEQEQNIERLEALAESMRIKNRLKNIVSDKILPLAKKVAKIPSKVLAILKVIKHNPALLKKVFYYAKRGELKYLITKIREKSSNNLSASQKLVEVSYDTYFTTYDKEKYTIAEERTIDIIIPVYNGYEFLEPLFDSIEQNTTASYRLLVINDYSPDERVKPYLLKRLKKHPTALFIDHEKNQGFLKSVNEAQKYTTDHFVLLNTDTEVPPHWLERLMYPIFHMDNIASTTPFTNSGEIASFPHFVADNEIFDSMSVGELDKVFQSVNATPFYAEVPTGVGFCMGVNHTLTKEIGMFAEDAFGKGYGEENDWCQRAIKQGYKNLIVPNLFVYHKHGGSFSTEEKQKLLQTNAIKLLERHPNYSKDVTAYIQEDPHHTLRHLLVCMSANKQAGTHLIFDHALGGGANLYTNERIEKYLTEEKSVLLVQYDFYSHCYKLTHAYKTFRFTFKISTFEALKIFIETLQLKEIFLNNLVSYPSPLTLITYIKELVERQPLQLTIPIHDFYSICPSYNLLNDTGKYCHIPKLETCKTCIKNNTQEWRNFFNDEVDIAKWRETWEHLLQRGTHILCFSNSSKEILLKAYPQINPEQINIVQHHVKDINPVILQKDVDKKTITIGVLGAIDYIKGAHIIKQMVQHIERDNLDIDVVVIGEITEPIRSKHFTVTGRYARDDLPALVKKYQVDIFLIPTIIPETFSYTTQEIMMMKLPLMVFKLGAPAERVSKYEKGYIIDEISAEAVLKTLHNLKTKGIQ